MSQYLRNIISQGEHQQLDFKFAIGDAKKIARSIVAFSNTDGGRLLIGVKDNGSIYGIRSEEEYYVLESAADMYCRPPIKIEFKRWVDGGKVILEVIIPKGKKPPYMAPDEKGVFTAYIRVDDENLKADRVWVKMWQRKKNKATTVISFSEKEKQLLEYLERHKRITFLTAERLLHLTSKDTEDLLVNLASAGVLKIRTTSDGVFYE